MQFVIPDNELEKIADVVQVCERWGTANGCKNGAKCRLRHAGAGRAHDPPLDPSSTEELYYVRHKDAQGFEFILPRLSATDMLNDYFYTMGIVVDRKQCGLCSRTQK